MERNIQKIGVVNWFALLIVGAISAVVARYAASAAGTVGVAFIGIGFLVALVSYFQMRLQERERLEKLEYDELRKSRGGTTLFQEAEADTFSASRSREQFERYLVPLFTALLFLLQSGAVWGFWKWLRTAAPPVHDRAPIAIALNALFALILFLLGKYSSGLARLEGQRLLRPGAGYLILGAFISALAAVTEGFAYFDFRTTDRLVAYGLCVVLALTAVETLVGLVFEIYRPRVKGQAARLLYESRLIGLLGRPGGLITTAAQALDYQFGFKVSETWVYKFLEKALAWIILLQLGALFASTMFVIIEPTEQGLLERLGRPVTHAVLEPGFHLKWPWPIDIVYRYSTRQIQSFVVGEVPEPDSDKEQTVLWTRPHSRSREGEGSEPPGMLVASRSQITRTDTNEKAVPANLLTVSIPFQYQITNLMAWAYRHADSDQLLQHLANREVVRYLVNVDMENIMSSGRLDAAEEIRERVQARANEANLGVSIAFVGLQDIHPPLGNKRTPVAAAFEQVVSAYHQKQTNILYALAYAVEKIPSAEAEATNILAQARNAAVTRVALAAGEAARFTNQMVAYEASPAVYLQRTRLETLVRSLEPVRKYILAATNTQDILMLNLEEKVRADLLGGTILPPDINKSATTK